MFKSSHLHLFLLVALSFHQSFSNSSAASLSPSILDEDGGPPCNGTDIPFPFVISGNLTPHPLLPGFNITCKQQNGGLQTLPPRLLLNTTELPLLEISLNEGFVRVDLDPFSWRCDRGFDEEEPSKVSGLLEGSPFTFSSTRNVLAVVGCDAIVFLRQQQVNKSSVNRSCVSFCESTESVVDGLCSGVGCCQASIPEKLKSFELEFKSIRNITGSRFDVLPCSRALIVEQKAFEFSAEELNRAAVGGTLRSVVLDWSIGNKSCEEAKRRGGDYYICADKAVCNDSSNGIGYLCRCNEGYEGNPYLKDGCKDIDECSNNATSPCHWKCKNSDGSYRCSCPFGTTGDGKKAGSGCKRVAPIEIALAAGFCLLLLLFVVVFLSYRKLKQRSVEKLKQKHFMQNGGLLFQQHFSVKQAAAKIFTAGELEMATDKFSESRILGHGGYGTVYKGVLSDGKEIAIKKSKLVDETQIEPFINEMVILSQINHRNVVKLLGCCLETQVPLLVYEFISNGTLFDHIHSDGKTFSLSWEIRLRIAGETAAALAYLHKADHSTPIIHRDVKSANILLDEEFTAKVSDFGASRLVPFNQTHVTTVVQGTLGYLDPEYFHTGLLSEKSDVYSFGVVLVELLTAEKPVSFAKSEEERNLASYFVRMVKEKRIVELVDRRVAEEAGHMSLSAFAELACSCLNVRGEDRPMMMEVAVELEALRRLSRLSRPPERLRGEEQSRCLLKPLSICRCEGEISAEEKLL